jgi:hypothetical protein
MSLEKRPFKHVMIEVFHFSEAADPPRNEDRLDFRPLPDGQEGYVCALADGQGGQAGGARAASLACEICVAETLKLPVLKLFVPGAWEEILHKADIAVSKDRGAGLTTLLAFGLAPNFVCGASCGDSALVVFQANAEYEILTRQQRKNPPIGSGGAVITTFTKKLLQPWTVLALSDGVWKYAGLNSIRETGSQKHGDEIINTLLDLVKLPGSGGLQDDFTLAVFHGSTTRISSQRQFCY